MICKSCQGRGYHVVLNRGKYKDLDKWDCKEFEGQKYHIKICTKCNGTGEIVE